MPTPVPAPERPPLRDSAIMEKLADMRATVGICAYNAGELAAEMARLAPRVEAVCAPTPANARDIELLVTWQLPRDLLAAMPGLRLVHANGAGVNDILSALDGAGGPVVCRTVEPGLAQGMVSYVTWAVLDHFRQMDDYRAAQSTHTWVRHGLSRPSSHRVGIAGAGALGMACAAAVANLGFPVRTWSRGEKDVADARIQHFAGDRALAPFLQACQTIVCLLPLTPETRGFLGRRVFSLLPGGAHLISVGRGEHLVESDLLDALQSGQLARATLDVLPVEPLPAAHPFWDHPRITITPHIAALAGAGSVAYQALSNLLALREGREPENKVDRARGY